ncbi:hypothetical protein [Arthrobacter sp. NPDC090010]|uniref:hypothetical protein n=1 Tax=Arthrobacter sp. NPDC090010 TaxID=3363942 RepID=UPI003819789B
MSSLPCGRTADEILQNLDGPPDAHEVQCPWCHQERARLKDLDVKLAALLRSQDTEDPSSDETAIDTVMRAIRENLRPLRKTTANSAASGAILEVTSLDLADAVRNAFGGMREIQVNYVDVRPEDRSAPHRKWRAECAVSVTPDSDLAFVEGTVVRNVAQGIRTLVEAERLTVDVTLEDVHGGTLRRTVLDS